MGFLDDLKRQADAVRERQDLDGADLARRRETTEQACGPAARYLRTLADQLEVLKPHSRARYALDRRHVFDGLPMTDFFADARRTDLGGQPVHQQLVLHWQLKTGRTLALIKDFPNEIEQLDARLHQSAAPVHKEVLRDPGNGKVVEVRYEVQADFRASVKLVPRHELARIELVAVNLDGLETVSGWLPAAELTEERLDELAKWIVGQPHRFLDGVRELRRHVP